MRLLWQILTPFLITLWFYPSNALCPSECICNLTEKGKRKVSCTKGGMLDPIPIEEMDIGMEILEITAPRDNKNTLTVSSIFKNFKQLEELRISMSNVQQINMHAFWGVPSIKVIDLTFNNISSVADHNFRGLVNLVELHLDDNQIENLQGGGFRHLTELRILTLERNKLSELVPHIFVKLAKLHVLKLSGNKIEELDPEIFKDIPDLRVLECRGCYLKRINTQIYHLLPYLTHLDLGNNQMQFLSDDEFQDLHRLHSLKLDGNLLPVILEKTFINNPQLKYLCLARNRLAKITNTAFLNLTNLVELDIGYNKLPSIEHPALEHISGSLQRLVISGNNFNLSVIKMVIHTLYKVWHLDMAKLKLRNLTENFIPDRIKKLNISRNNLTEIHYEVLPKQLTDLDISYNQLQGLPERVILKMERLKSVNLSENPWACDLCHIAPILFRVNNSNLFKELTCASPKALKGKRLTSLHLEDVTSCHDPLANEEDTSSAASNSLSLVVGIISLVIFATFSVIFVTCSCIRRHSRNIAIQQKRNAEALASNLNGPTAIFSKEEISFKFPLDLTERRVSVSTIDKIHKEEPEGLSNGIGVRI